MWLSDDCEGTVEKGGGVTMQKKTEEAISKMRQLYEEGKTMDEIAEATGYKASSVKVMLKKGGVNRERKIEPYMPTIITMRKNGVSIKEIAEEVGFNASYISHLLCEIGYRKVRKDRAPSEPSVDESKLVYADNTIRIPRVVIGGKVYLDVTALF